MVGTGASQWGIEMSAITHPMALIPVMPRYTSEGMYQCVIESVSLSLERPEFMTVIVFHGGVPNSQTRFG